LVARLLAASRPPSTSAALPEPPEIRLSGTKGASARSTASATVSAVGM